jgi:hypothetical protein
MCKKLCYRASIASENNKEYKNVCISSSNNQQNIYNFCEEKMSFLNLNMVNLCKLDMCNLCCVGMDTIKNRNYSFSNLKNCFVDCSNSFNSNESESQIPNKGNNNNANYFNE